MNCGGALVEEGNTDIAPSVVEKSQIFVLWQKVSRNSVKANEDFVRGAKIWDSL